MDKRNRCMCMLIGEKGFTKGKSLVIRALCVCLCVYNVCVCACTCLYVYHEMCVEVRGHFRCQLFPPIFVKKGYFAVFLCGCWPTRFQCSLVSASHLPVRVLGFRHLHCISGFYMGSGDSNPDPYPCSAGTISSQPLIWTFKGDIECEPNLNRDT